MLKEIYFKDNNMLWILCQDKFFSIYRMVGNFFISFFTNFISDQKSPPLSLYYMRRLPKTLQYIELKDTLWYLHPKKLNFSVKADKPDSD